MWLASGGQPGMLQANRSKFTITVHNVGYISGSNISHSLERVNLYIPDLSCPLFVPCQSLAWPGPCPFAFQNSSSTNALLPQQTLSCPWILMMDKRKYSASDGVDCVSVWVLFRVPLFVFSNKCSCCFYIESGVFGVSTFTRSSWLTKDTQITLDSSWTDTYT